MTLLSQLTQVGDYSEAQFLERLNELQQRPDAYHVVVIEGESALRCGRVVLLHRTYI